MNSLLEPSETQLAAGLSPWAIDLQTLHVLILPVRPGRGLGLGQRLGSASAAKASNPELPEEFPSVPFSFPKRQLPRRYCLLALVNFTHFYISDALKMPLTVPLEHTLSEVEFQLGSVLHSDYC